MHEQPPSVSQALTDGDGRVKRRRRPALSCVECRLRKVRCDRAKPCGACIRTGSERCTYRSAQAATRTASEKSSDATPGSRNDNRSPAQSSFHEYGPTVSWYNATGLEGAQAQSDYSSSAARRSSVDVSSCAEGRAALLVKALLTENERLRSATTENPTHEDSTRPISDIITDIPGTFQKSKFFGQSHWMNAMEPVSTSPKGTAVARQFAHT